jgi:hypothetical protein
MDTAILDFIKSAATKIIESGEVHQPMLFALTPSGIAIINIIETPKELFGAFVAYALHQISAYGYILINEAWQAEAKDKGEQERLQKFLGSGKQVSDLPLDDRTEILIITCYQLD